MSKSGLDRVILASCISTSGKWRLLLAEHIINGSFCYDVVGVNVQTGEITSRHYRSPGVAPEANRAEALRVYDGFREKLQMKAEEEEKDEPRREFRIILPEGD